MSELTLKYKLLRSFQGKFKIGKKINYYSGAGFFIGSNKVELILKYGNYFKNSFIIDDVLIGLILFSCENSKSSNNILKILEINLDSGFKLSNNIESDATLEYEITDDYEIKIVYCLKCIHNILG